MLKTPSSRIHERANPNTKVLYDKSLSEWTSKYVKNKRELDRVTTQCDHLRHEAMKLQEQVEESTKTLKNMEDKYNNELAQRFQQSKANYEHALQQKQILQNQIAENRKLKQTLSKEKSSLTADYDRKYAELTKTLEHRAKLDDQLARLSQQLSDLAEERKRGEKELAQLQGHLKENSDLVDNLNSDMVDVREGIKASVENHMLSASAVNSRFLDPDGAEG
ncbi:unnamed protein product [Amoebophrya sp. A120]|nr:unnamed protein product [Amoebophrya sp. A120]|eukprot:GSA120T00017941001.1